MPVAMLKSLAKQSGKSLATAERYWDDAKKSASEKFKEKDGRYWAYAAAIVKRRLGLNESAGFKNFLIKEDEEFQREKEHVTQRIDEVARKIKRDCGEFLSRSKWLPLYRGQKFSKENYFYSTHDDRWNKDTSALYVGLINIYVEHKFGLENFRNKNVIFTNGSEDETHLYATGNDDIKYVFPFDGFDFLWSPLVRDFLAIQGTIQEKLTKQLSKEIPNETELNSIFSKLRNSIIKHYPITIKKIMDDDILILTGKNNPHILKDYVMEPLKEIFDDYDYSMKNLSHAISAEVEIAVRTKEYYAIPTTDIAIYFDEPDDSMLAYKLFYDHKL